MTATRPGQSSGSILAEPAKPGSTSSLLARLSTDIGDPVIVERFVHDYLSLLDDRLDTLRRLLAHRDADATRLAILSLESSSVMLGASDLAAAARALLQAVMGPSAALEQPLFAEVVESAGQLRRQLAALGFVS